MNATAEITNKTANTIVALKTTFSAPLFVVEMVPVPPNVVERPELLFWIRIVMISRIAMIAWLYFRIVYIIEVIYCG